MKTTLRAPMPPSVRAKQFAPYQALNGFMEAIMAAERYEIPRKILGPDRLEEINNMLLSLRKGQKVSVIYYEEYEKSYVYLTGAVTKLDSYFGLLQVDNRVTYFSEIDDVALI